MGIAIPQVITDRSGAQVIDGSLKFDQGITQHLTRTPSSDGNKRTWTWSGWVKPAAGALGDASGSALFAAYSAANDRDVLRFGGSSTDAVDFQHRRGGSNYGGYTDAKLRDYGGSGWYHVVLAWNDAATIYVNGVEQSLSGVSNDANNGQINNNVIHYIGARSSSGSAELGWDGQMSQIYFIDGQALEPTEFGFTDPLTNTWKPKKYTGTFARSSVNDGTTWSSSISGPVDSTYPLSNAFGGTIGSSYTSGTRPTVGNTLTFDISSKNLTVAKVRLNTFLSVAGSGATLQVNDTDVTTNLANGDQTHEITINGQFNNVKWSYDDGNGPYVYMRGIEVDLGTGRGYELLTDGLTDTGANSFYLPLDGNSPIGKDQSGNGNDWTPVNFGGSVELDSPTVSGARPILNTTQGGTQAGVGVFGSKQNVGYAVTVYNDGGGNKYYIDGVKQDTVTGLIRGATYTFDTSDSTVSSHPFRFSATSNGSHGGGSEYTSGVAAITGAATTITVPHDAPNTLYYYCTSHSGMGADITGITTNEKLADQYASKCVLALPLVGSTSDVSASIACTSSTKSVTNQSTTASSISEFYGGSREFDGSTTNSPEYLDLGTTGIAFNNSSWTIEVWFYVTSTSSGNLFFTGSGWNNNQGAALTFQSNKFRYNQGSGGSISSFDSINAISTDVWQHFALVADGTNVEMFINGVTQGTTTQNNSIGGFGNDFLIGAYRDTNYQAGPRSGINGFLQDFRIYSGVAKYTSNFVPAANSPDILPDTPSGVSGSSKLTKITEGAVSFGANASDKLRFADSNDMSFGTNDFTFETYYYHESQGSFDIMFDNLGSNRSGSQFSINGSGNYAIEIGDGSGNWVWQHTSQPARVNRWTHFAVTRQGSTFRAFVDGVQFATTTSSTAIGNPQRSAIGGYTDNDSSNYGFNGFLSNMRIVNGTAVYTANFTPPTKPLTNVTNTKLLCCQSPTSATTAAVAPGSITAAGDAAATNFNPFNTDINTVRGQETGYCTLNPLRGVGTTSILNKPNPTLSDGNLTASAPSGGNDTAGGTIGVSSGKWYFELTNVSGGNNTDGVGLADFTNGKEVIYRDNADFRYDGSTSSYGASWQTSGDVVGVKIDLDNSTIGFFVNGVYQGDAKTDLPSVIYHPLVYNRAGVAESDLRLNFGQKPFKFPPPDGFQPLTTANTRPVNVISRPDQYVGVTTYAGDGTSVVVSDYLFKPDLVWIKGYTDADRHGWYDSVRGAQKRLQTAHPNAEDTQNGVMSFDDRGFSVGNYSDSNGSGRGYVAWSWKAGGNAFTYNKDGFGGSSASDIGVSATTLTLTGASINTESKFGIYAYTGSGSGGATITHGLGGTPAFVVYKKRTGSSSWQIYHKSLGGTKYMNWDEMTNAYTSDSTRFGGTDPTSTTITLGTHANGDVTTVLYAWCDVPGLQKFGSFVGNGSSDGPFVELGFRPTLLWIKNADTDNETWCLHDDRRDTFNPAKRRLSIDSDSAQDASQSARNKDFLSNGFKIRGASGEQNTSGETYIYGAWAAAPSIDLFGGGANAR